MSSDWKIATLEDLIRPGSSITYGVVKPGERDADGVLFIRGGDIANGEIQTSQLRTITPEISQQYKRTLLKGGELLVSLVGNPGQVAIVPPSLAGANIARQVGLVRLGEQVEPNFVKYYLLSQKGQEALGAKSKGSVQQVINLKDLKTVRIPVPDLPEQRAIAKILSSLDDKIELNRRMNATLEAMARALFKAWFVDFEPVHANKEDRPSTSASPEIAKLFPSEFENGIPKGWRIGTLSEIAINYRQNIDPNEINSEAPYVGLEHIPRKSLALTEWGTASKAESTKSDFRANDILFGKLRPYFHKVVIAPVDGICSTDVLVVRPKEKYHLGQAAIQFSSDPLIQYATQLSNGAKMPRTSWSDLAKFEVVVPSRPVSEEFTESVGFLVARILSNVNESRILGRTRDRILPRLINGSLEIAGSVRGE